MNIYDKEQLAKNAEQDLNLNMLWSAPNLNPTAWQTGAKNGGSCLAKTNLTTNRNVSNN